MSKCRTKKQLIQEMYVDKTIPVGYDDFYVWVMSKPEFHWLFEFWYYKRLDSGLMPYISQIGSGASLRDFKISPRRNCKGERNVSYKGLHKDLKVYVTLPGKKKKKRAVIKRVGGYLCQKPVKQYSRDMDLIREFDSRNEVERELGYPAKSIVDVCNGRRKTAYKFRWKFANNC